MTAKRGVFPLMHFIALMAYMLAFCLAGGESAEALRLPEEGGRLQVRVHAQWNQRYLCLAVRVPDTILTGTSTAAMSTPEQDDAIEFDFELPTARGLSAHRLVIGVAGGMTLFSRDESGHWRTDPSWVAGPRTVKFAVAEDGTLNNPRDKDGGYTIECAIPWPFMCEQAPAGQEIGFNVVCWIKGENEAIASWSPSVSDPTEVGEAVRWGRMLISTGAGLGKAMGSWVPCPFASQMPFIDGRLAADEWLTAATLSFERPQPVIEALASPPEKAGVAATLMAIYRYDWMGGLGAESGAPFWNSRGGPATSHQPRIGAGPWQNFTRVDWHADELSEIQRAGIDIILARYSGEDRARRTWARAGLERLTQALKQRRAGGLGYPLVGMMLDTSALKGVDLSSDAGCGRLYGMVREFFMRVPREFWAQVGGSPEEGLTPGVPILLGEPGEVVDWDAGTFASCEELFAEDFSGARIAWLGSSAWRRKDVEFHSFVDLPGAAGMSLSSPSGATAVALSPGFCPPPGESKDIRPRAGGTSYRSDWQRAFAVQPELIIVDSWNDYERGTEIAPSRQYGVLFVDMTRYFQSRLGSEKPHELSLKHYRIPDLLLPGATCYGEFLVENIGTESLQTGVRTTVDYEMRRRSDDAVVLKKTAAQRLSVAAGQTKRIPVAISAIDANDDPLSPGEYLFTLRVVQSKVAYVNSRWFAKPIAELTVPITVGDPPAWKATVMSTSLPASMATGSTKQMIVRLRNDGRETWRQGTTSLSYRWLLFHDEWEQPTNRAREIVVRESVRAELPEDVGPGEVVSVVIPVSAQAADGRPLPVLSPETLRHYRLQWLLIGDDARSSLASASAAGEEAIQVLARDDGDLIESVVAPTTIAAGETATAILTVGNDGDRVWRSDETSVVCRWHRWDGRASDAPEKVTHLTTDVLPGERLEVEGSLIAPDAPGPYWLAWGIVDETHTQESIADGFRARAIAPVLVSSPHQRPVDLSAFVNVPALTTEDYRARGDFDGRGNSLPAEWFPADQSSPHEDLYPAGYYAPQPDDGGVVFAFPDLHSGIGGAIACTGQWIPLGEEGAAAVHLVAAATAGAKNVSFKLETEEGEVTSVLVEVPAWDTWDGETSIAFYSPYVRSLQGDMAGRPAFLYRITVASPSGSAVRLGLPKDPHIKVLAVTAESKPR